MMEATSSSIIQIDPQMEIPQYYVVGKSRGVDGPNKCLRYNKNESCIFVNDGKKISVWEVGIDNNRGIRKAGIDITISNKNPEVIIEDFVTLKDKGVVTTDSTGLIELFFFDLKNKIFKKLSEFDINKQEAQSGQTESVTTMSFDETETMLTVSTVSNNKSSPVNQLSRLLVLDLDIKGNLHLNCQKKFEGEKVNSMYFYVNFEYSYKGVPLVYAFQNEDQMRLDIFGLRNGVLSLIHSQPKFHSTDFSAIRSINGRFISIDYDGVMRVLEVPE